MSGHNKWSKIKRKKEVTDARKSRIFSKLVRFITVEAKKAGGGTDAPGLRLAIEKARAANMPSENIERAIRKATEPGAAMEAIIYEAYGPGGAGLIIECLTDNRNKAAQEVKHILSKNGGVLGTIGSVTWSFERKDGKWEPVTTVPIDEGAAEELSALIDELEENEEVQDVYTNAE